jgi:hypothetical protein
MIQYSRSNSSVNGAAGDPMQVWLRFPSLPGNCLIVGIQCDTSQSGFSITDDRGNTWSAGPNIVGGNRMQLFYKLNAAQGTTHIQVAFTGAGNPGFMQCFVAEFCGVASSGSSTNAAGATGQVTTVAAGSISPSAGDLIIQYAQDETSVPSNGITGWTKGSGFTKLSCDRLDGIFIQWRAAPGGAINPTFTVGGSTENFETIAMSLPADSAAGTALPSGIQVIGAHAFSVNITNSSNPVVVDVPCFGNMLIVQTIFFSVSGGAPVITSITDSRSASYIEVGSNVQGVALDPAQMFYAVAAGDQETVLTINLANFQNGGSSIVVLDVVGALSSPLDVFADTTGNQTSAGDLFTATLNPNTSNGLCVGHVSVNSHTVNGLNSPGFFDAFSVPGEDGGSNPLHQDNGWGHFYNRSPSPQSFTWTVQHNTAGVGTWGAKAAAFKGVQPAIGPHRGALMMAPTQRMG